ncbi:MAG: BMC domain-containing protein [Clostridia bacterium]|nr:BMC domain-containing protein [Clostridia bacterium]
MKKAVGFVETRGLVGAIEAADAMVKAAEVRILEYRQVGSGLISIIIQGDVAAVQAAVQAGSMAAEKVGEVVSVNVIPRPNEELAKLLPLQGQAGDQ